MRAVRGFVAIAALVVLAAGEVSAQRLSVNPYSGLGFATSAPPDLCKMSTSGVDADARDTARNIAEASGTPPQLELNNCHLHPVATTFSVSGASSSPCHPDHEPPAGNCGRPAAEWCDDPCAGVSCGGSGCVSPRCYVVGTSHEVSAPSWSYTFPLDASNSHELDLDATRMRKSLMGNCACLSYSLPACPPPPPPPPPPPEDEDDHGGGGGPGDDDRGPWVEHGDGGCEGVPGSGCGPATDPVVDDPPVDDDDPPIEIKPIQPGVPEVNPYGGPDAPDAPEPPSTTTNSFSVDGTHAGGVSTTTTNGQTTTATYTDPSAADAPAANPGNDGGGGNDGNSGGNTGGNSNATGNSNGNFSADH